MAQLSHNPNVEPINMSDKVTDKVTAQGAMSTPLGNLWVSASAEGLTEVVFREGRPVGSPSALVSRALNQLAEYFDGERQTFDVPLAAVGTDFQQSVWAALCELPYGVTASYRDIAVRIAKPKAVRAVGAANGRNPLAIIVPCHRVIGADGSLTGYAGGLPRKQWLLQHEGCGTLAAMAQGTLPLV